LYSLTPGRRAAEDDLDPGQQLTQTEGFGHIIIAQFQSQYFIHLVTRAVSKMIGVSIFIAWISCIHQNPTCPEASHQAKPDHTFSSEGIPVRRHPAIPLPLHNLQTPDFTQARIHGLFIFNDQYFKHDTIILKEISNKCTAFTRLTANRYGTAVFLHDPSYQFNPIRIL
jgi:hypothetical protein